MSAKDISHLKIEAICLGCPTKFIKKWETNNYCSTECFNVRKRVLVDFICKQCGKIQKVRNSDKLTFCSYACSNTFGMNAYSVRNNCWYKKNCKQCNKEFDCQKCGPTEFCSVKCSSRFSALNGLNLPRKPRAYKFSKAGFRKDIGHFVRSMFEANYARILNFNKVKYEYEPKTFNLKTTSYTPDFYIPKEDRFVELKGRYFGINKIRKFKKMFPKIKYSVIFQDSNEWKLLTKQYKNLIPTWE